TDAGQLLVLGGGEHGPLPEVFCFNRLANRTASRQQPRSSGAFHLSPLTGRGRLASGALAKRSKSGEGGFPAGTNSRPRPLTRIPSLRLRCARNPTSPRKRGEVGGCGPREPKSHHQQDRSAAAGCRIIVSAARLRPLPQMREALAQERARIIGR